MAKQRAIGSGAGLIARARITHWLRVLLDERVQVFVLLSRVSRRCRLRSVPLSCAEASATTADKCVRAVRCERQNHFSRTRTTLLVRLRVESSRVDRPTTTNERANGLFSRSKMFSPHQSLRSDLGSVVRATHNVRATYASSKLKAQSSQLTAYSSKLATRNLATHSSEERRNKLIGSQSQTTCALLCRCRLAWFVCSSSAR